MIYQIRWTESAYRKLEKLDSPVGRRIVSRLEEIVKDPFVAVKRLSGTNLYTIRIGEYRAILSIDGARLLILVVDVGHRSKIYKKF